MYKPDCSTRQAHSIGSGCGVGLPAEVVDAEAPDACGRVIRLELGLLGGSRLHEPPCEALLLLWVRRWIASCLVQAEDAVQFHFSWRC